ncbi:CU044_2847 family protein [Leptothoe sp. LEGE 181152]|nr:CU044_2847 family protein [Leptothoe sp. LEGE 181152]
MDRALAQFMLEDGTSFLVEIEEPKSSVIERVALLETEAMVYKAKKNLEEALDVVKPVASTLISKLKSGMPTPINEVQVTFGLKLSAEAGVVFSSVGGEVTFEVTLKWSKDN